MKSRFWLVGATVSIFLAVSLLNSKRVWAVGEYQTCYQNSTCVVGEFLYNDSYVPIATADCRLTSRYPDGELYINSATMSASVDGWYFYEVQATGSAGLYRSQICCSDGTDYLCLDKSFQVEATSSSGLTKADVASAVWDEPRSSHNQSGSFGQALQNAVPSVSEIAAAIWGYSGRTLTGFNNLPSDIWNYSSRSLSSVSSLVSRIWSHSDRTVSNSGSSNTIDTSDLAKKTDLDNLKNEVMYNQSLLEKLANKPIIKNYLEEEPDLDLESKLNQTQAGLTKIFSDSYAMDSKLGMLDLKWAELDNQELQTIFKDIANLNTSLVKTSRNIKEAWNLSLADNLFIQAQALASRIAIIKGELAIEDNSGIVLTEINNLSSSLNTFIATLGSLNDKPSQQTLFGQFKAIKGQVDTLDLYASNTDKLLSNWRKLNLETIQAKTNRIADNLARINRLPSSIMVVSSSTQDSLPKKLKNRLLSIKATIMANKLFLAKKTSKPFSSSWLEEGSVIFKTLLTNPSTRISQTVPLKYYLPAEISKENIIDKDKGLKIKYDVEKKQLYVEGEFELAAFESKVVVVRVEDIWLIREESLESLRRQAEELTKPLEKTVYFGQGVTIKSNIDVILDKIINKQRIALTPEAKIKNYYEAQIELESVKEQIAKLEDLVTQAGSFGSMAGFVGGSQAIAVWGLIIIIVAGFVFMVIYMKALRHKETGTTAIPGKNLKKKPKLKSKKPVVKAGLSKQELAYFATVFLVMNVLASFLTSFMVYRAFNSSKTVASATEEPTKLIEKSKEKALVAKPKVLGMVMKKPAMVKVIDLQGDVLRIRETPAGKMIGLAQSGERFKYLNENDDWVKVEIEDGSIGYLAKEFVLKEDEIVSKMDEDSQ